MSTASVRLLRVGVLGLGSAWQQRYKPALLASRSRFEVVALGDPIQQRAAHEARRLGCRAAEGPSDLLLTPDLDALLLLETAWYGLWPLEQAARLGKPVFCVPSLAADASHAERIGRLLEETRLPVMFETWSRCTAATVHLRRLLRQRLGGLRVLLVQASLPGGRSQAVGEGRLRAGEDQLADLVDWCNHLMGTLPARVQGAALARRRPDGFQTFLLEYEEDRLAQISVVPSAPGLAERATPGGKVLASIVAEHGQASVALPHQLNWTYRGLTCRQQWRQERSVEQRLLRRFHQLVNGTRAKDPGLREARQVLRILEAVKESRAQGWPIELPNDAPE